MSCCTRFRRQRTWITSSPLTRSSSTLSCAAVCWTRSLGSVAAHMIHSVCLCPQCFGGRWRGDGGGGGGGLAFHNFSMHLFKMLHLSFSSAFCCCYCWGFFWGVGGGCLFVFFVFLTLKKKLINLLFSL